MSDPELIHLIEAAEKARDELQAACAACEQADRAKHVAGERLYEADRAVHEYVEQLRAQIRGAP